MGVGLLQSLTMAFQDSGFHNKEIYHQSNNYFPNAGHKNQIQWVASGDVVLKGFQIFK